MLPYITTYFKGVTFPEQEDCMSLEADITLKAIMIAIEVLVNKKSSRPDSITWHICKVFRVYKNQSLLQMNQAAIVKGYLPESLYVTSIIVLLMPDKEPSDCGSYRPISLLNVAYKILTKILAKQLNK